jgi:hypothetical protein
VSIAPQRLTVRLAWAGRVLDGPLKKRVKASEACWALDTSKLTLQELQSRLPQQQQQQKASGAVASESAGRTSADAAAAAAGRQVFEFVELLIVLPKEEGGHYWRALFEGGEEKSHMEVSGRLSFFVFRQARSWPDCFQLESC